MMMSRPTHDDGDQNAAFQTEILQGNIQITGSRTHGKLHGLSRAVSDAVE